jgi:hypothetical protein
MSFSDRAQAQDETPRSHRRPGLIRMSDDARIEQGRRLERILIQEIGADELPLGLRESHMRREGIFHFVGACLENRQQVAMATLEVVEDLDEQAGSRFRVERQDPIDDVIRPCLVCNVEVARLRRRLERPHDHARRIGSQIQSLPIQKSSC